MLGKSGIYDTNECTNYYRIITQSVRSNLGIVDELSLSSIVLLCCCKDSYGIQAQLLNSDTNLVLVGILYLSSQLLILLIILRVCCLRLGTHWIRPHR
jgi:hypothetical protein